MASFSSSNNQDVERPHSTTTEKIIVVGSSNQDLTSYTNSIPTMGQTVMGQRFEVSPGGKGANQGKSYW